MTPNLDKKDTAVTEYVRDRIILNENQESAGIRTMAVYADFYKYCELFNHYPLSQQQFSRCLQWVFERNGWRLEKAKCSNTNGSHRMTTYKHINISPSVHL